MALTECHECGSRISTNAKTCPRCGAPMKEGIGHVLMPRRRGTPEGINWPLRILVALVCGVVAIVLFSLSH
jgi:predicted amidophosphoribosyltransferase